LGVVHFAKRSFGVVKNLSSMKTRFIAFLRGVNVAGRTIKKDALAESFTRAGLTNVRTHIARPMKCSRSCIRGMAAPAIPVLISTFGIKATTRFFGAIQKILAAAARVPLTTLGEILLRVNR
jgi:hypothetical protein